MLTEKEVMEEQVKGLKRTFMNAFPLHGGKDESVNEPQPINMELLSDDQAGEKDIVDSHRLKTSFSSDAEKPTNPKDIIGTDKVPMNMVPATTIAYLALGHLEGNLKYGRSNWRETGVKASVYLDALQRHIKKFDDGQWADPQTKVPHLANALACLSIIVDAYECGVLVDDRPKQGAGPATIDRLSGVVKHLRELFKDKDPKHYLHEGEVERYL